MKHPTGNPATLKNNAKKMKGYKVYDKTVIYLPRQESDYELPGGL